MANPLLSENIWFGKYQCENAERVYREQLSGVAPRPAVAAPQQTQSQKPAGKNTRRHGKQHKVQKPPSSDLVNQIAKAREQIQKSLDNAESVVPAASGGGLEVRIAKLEQENKDLSKVTEDLQAMIKKLESRVGSLEASGPAQEKKDSEKPAAVVADDDDDDDDIDLFGSDDEADEEAERLKEERLKQYQEKKGTKKAVIAKSSIIMDVKTWGDEVDMKEVEKLVRDIKMDGLFWGHSKVLPVAYGVKKLQIICIIEDDKISTEDLQERIEANEDHVQSTDIVAFNKI